ncbi:hypothetical protein [Pandoraea fibrosis]|uniref:Uncharacterized protein n=1 Tax=Pandoraea fibrosis TaxID=1891094 RepID=A0A5E4SQS6_9BURK|nr:hypothetical protein [Pandoraea fibrosis]VVD78057.1 hypothetical protein PFI31113_00961 [Pandoraea fibrosis]
MRIRKNRSALIHRSALGGYTIEGPYNRNRSVRSVIARVIAWIGGAR